MKIGQAADAICCVDVDLLAQMAEERQAEQEEWRRQKSELQDARIECSVEAERVAQHLKSRVESLMSELTTQVCLLINKGTAFAPPAQILCPLPLSPAPAPDLAHSPVSYP